MVAMYLLVANVAIFPVVIARWLNSWDLARACDSEESSMSPYKSVLHELCLAKYVVASFEHSSHLASGRSSASLYPSSFNISRSSSATLSCRLSGFISSSAVANCGSYCSDSLSLPSLALFCQLDNVCIAISSCFAVAEILPLLSAIFLTASALN